MPGPAFAQPLSQVAGGGRRHFAHQLGRQDRGAIVCVEARVQLNHISPDDLAPLRMEHAQDFAHAQTARFGVGYPRSLGRIEPIEIQRDVERSICLLYTSDAADD